LHLEKTRQNIFEMHRYVRESGGKGKNKIIEGPGREKVKRGEVTTV
jgi:hypothetical protein